MSLSGRLRSFLHRCTSRDFVRRSFTGLPTSLVTRASHSFYAFLASIPQGCLFSARTSEPLSRPNSYAATSLLLPRVAFSVARSLPTSASYRSIKILYLRASSRSRPFVSSNAPPNGGSSMNLQRRIFVGLDNSFTSEN